MKSNPKPFQTLALTALTALVLSACSLRTAAPATPEAKPNANPPRPPSAATVTPMPPPKHVIGYFPAGAPASQNYYVKDIRESGSAKNLTHINYAFANISSDLKCVLGDPVADFQKAHTAANSLDGVADDENAATLKGNFNQLRKLKAQFPNIKLLISIGGWDWSDKFSDAALTPESRKAFVASCVDLYIKGNFAPNLSAPGLFDGIDIDWEFPGVEGATKNYRAEDTQNFTALLAEFRAQLKAVEASTQKNYWLSIAAPATQEKIKKIEVGKIYPYLDYISVMSYDFHGAWDNYTNFHSSLYGSAANPVYSYQTWTDSAIQAYLNGGVPAQKMVMGVAFFGRGWHGVGPTNNGLWQPAQGAAPGSHGDGTSSYRVLKALQENNPQYEGFRDDVTQGAWLYNKTAGIFWGFDDAQAISRKMSYVMSRNLGGVMIWELSADSTQGELIKAVSGGLR
ncbi:MAG: glycosyl hydrolase family 18 protein [Anaerolineae bacterium]|nr:glycosyl hydrolase family 18 protein [Anaerolineae bacterium]